MASKLQRHQTFLLAFAAICTIPIYTACTSPQRQLLDFSGTSNSAQPQPPPRTPPTRADLLFGNRTAGWFAVGLLPEPLDLMAEAFTSPFDSAGQPQRCDEKDIVAGQLRTLVLPRHLPGFTLMVLLDLPRYTLGASEGELLTAGGVRIEWDPAAGMISLYPAWSALRSLAYLTPLGRGANGRPLAVLPPVLLSISRRSDGALAVCLNGTAPPLYQSQNGSARLSGGWLAGTSVGIGWSLAATDALLIGNPRSSLGTRLHQIWFVNKPWGCNDVSAVMFQNAGSFPPPAAAAAAAAPPPAPAPGSPTPSGALSVTGAMFPGLVSYQYGNRLPALSRLEVVVEQGGTGADGEAFVGQEVRLEGEVVDPDGDEMVVRTTWYGVPPRDCSQSECGDTWAELNGTGTVALSASAVYQLPGRYVVRVEASDMTGAIAAWDVPVLVRKLGDTARQAPCCRSTGMVIAGQNGRPVHRTQFRDPQATRLAQDVLGWTADYLAGEDLEAERLFDFGVLAPRHEPSGLQLTRCVDLFLAGPGSPRVLNGNPAVQGLVTMGHNKRVLVVPQGFSWGASLPRDSPGAPACESHWSQWPATSPYKMVTGKLPDGSPSYCSYACTPDGFRSLQQLTGLTDRLAEALVELSYGRLSLSWQLDVTNTLLLPQQPAANNDSYAYSGAPLAPFLQAARVNRSAYHSAIVLSPAPPLAYNPGKTAWTDVAGGTLFVMRCMPQLYYLVHEMGHLLGLPHANVRIMDNAMVAPSDPAGPGKVEDFYSDKLDMMACCRGDYSAQARLMLGWMPYPERQHIPLSETLLSTSPQTPPPSPPPQPSSSSSSGAPDPTAPAAQASTPSCSPSAGPTGCSYTLWPVDRAESRGRLKALTLRLSATQLVVLSYKALPWWSDVRLGRGLGAEEDDERQSLSPDEMRAPLAGLSAEYMIQGNKSMGSPDWSARGLLDFNLLFGEWPAALPPAPRTLPPQPAASAFALLKPGQAWLHADSGVLVVAQAEVECDSQAEVPVYNYSAPNFYGFRGEYPGTEGFRRADYGGYSGGLRCLRVAVRTRVPQDQAPEKLLVRLRVLPSEPLRPRLQLLPDNGTGDNTASSNNCVGGDSRGDCARSDGPTALPPWMAAAVWRDPRNVTFAADTLTATLPPFADGWMREASAADSPPCMYGCDPTYRIHVASYGGAQTLVSVRVAEASMQYMLLHVSYRYYGLDEITTESEVLYVPLRAPWAAVTAAAVEIGAGSGSATPPAPPASPGSDTRTGLWGLQLLGDAGGPRRLDEQPQLTWTGQQLPPTVRSQQWTLTLLLQLRPGTGPRVGRWPLASAQLFTSAASSPSNNPTAPLALWLVRGGRAPAPGSAYQTGALTGGGTVPQSEWSVVLVLPGNREVWVAMAAPPQTASSRVYHAALVYDAGRLGVWVDGGGGWPVRDAACVPQRPGVLYCAGQDAADGGDDGYQGEEEAEPLGPLRSVSLLGGSTGGPDASLLSARVYNYALPRADLADEATCRLQQQQQQQQQPGACAARFGLLDSSPTPPAAPPSAPASSSQAVGGGPQDSVTQLRLQPGRAVALPVAAAGQLLLRQEWDLLAATAATSHAAVPAAAPDATVAQHRLLVGNWSACSAPCGGGVSVRSVLCLRATARGPWAVGPDDCPLRDPPRSARACNTQPCPARWAALVPAPGPDRCLRLPACSDSNEEAPLDLHGLPQPMCLQDGGVQLPLSACAAGGSSPWASVAAGGRSANAAGKLRILGGALTGSVDSNMTAAVGSSRAGSEQPQPPEGLTRLISSPWNHITLRAGAGDEAVEAGGEVEGAGQLRQDRARQQDPSIPAAVQPATLRQALLSAASQPSCNLTSARHPPAACVPDGPVWQLGPWGPCVAECHPAGNSTLSRGVRVRNATCISAVRGVLLDAWVCESVLGPLPQGLLTGSCGGVLCAGRLPVWRVGPWSGCDTTTADGRSSALGFGSMRREVTCAGAIAGTVAAGSSAEAQCGDDGGLAAGTRDWLRPREVAACVAPQSFSGVCTLGSGPPCSGHGRCSYAGCTCNPGFTGQLCEVALVATTAPSPAPATTLGTTPSQGCPSGVQDRAGACCETGVLDVDGACCGSDSSPGSGGGGGGGVPKSSDDGGEGSGGVNATVSAGWSLDGSGRCCSQAVDPCGVCGGNGVSVDVQGRCCPTRLDQYGLCCDSDMLDECGVCDGDGTSCALRLQMWLGLPPGALDVASAATSDGGMGTPSDLSSTAIQALGTLLGLALPTSQARTALRLSLGAVQVAGSGSVAGPLKDGQLRRLLQQQEQQEPEQQDQLCLVTYDITYHDEADEAGTGADARPAAQNAGNSIGPVGPYDFTTSAVGLRLEALAQLLQGLDVSYAEPPPQTLVRYAEGVRVADSASVQASKTAWTGGSEGDTDPLQTQAVTDAGGGAGGVEGMEPDAPSAEAERAEPALQQASNSPNFPRQQVMHAEMQDHLLMLARGSLGAGQRRDALASSSAVQAGTAGATADVHARRSLTAAMTTGPGTASGMLITPDGGTLPGLQPPPPTQPPQPTAAAGAAVAVLVMTAALASAAGAIRDAAVAMGLQGMQVAGLERLGVCGNGVCEVGEQAWGLAAAASACPQDCPLQLQMCPSGSRVGAGPWAVGTDGAQQCSGRGACLISSGECACFEGYTGEACDSCAPGFWRAAQGHAAGACVRQYIRGRTLLEWDAVLSVQSSGRTWPLGSLLTFGSLMGASAAVAVAVLVSLAVYMARRGKLPFFTAKKAAPPLLAGQDAAEPLSDNKALSDGAPLPGGVLPRQKGSRQVLLHVEALDEDDVEVELEGEGEGQMELRGDGAQVSQARRSSGPETEESAVSRAAKGDRLPTTSGASSSSSDDLRPQRDKEDDERSRNGPGVAQQTRQRSGSSGQRPDSEHAVVQPPQQTGGSRERRVQQQQQQPRSSRSAVSEAVEARRVRASSSPTCSPTVCITQAAVESGQRGQGSSGGGWGSMLRWLLRGTDPQSQLQTLDQAQGFVGEDVVSGAGAHASGPVQWVQMAAGNGGSVAGEGAGSQPLPGCGAGFAATHGGSRHGPQHASLAPTADTTALRVAAALSRSDGGAGEPAPPPRQLPHTPPRRSRLSGYGNHSAGGGRASGEYDRSLAPVWDPSDAAPAALVLSPGSPPLSGRTPPPLSRSCTRRTVSRLQPSAGPATSPDPPKPQHHQLVTPPPVSGSGLATGSEEEPGLDFTPRNLGAALQAAAVAPPAGRSWWQMLQAHMPYNPTSSSPRSSGRWWSPASGTAATPGGEGAGEAAAEEEVGGEAANATVSTPLLSSGRLRVDSSGRTRKARAVSATLMPPLDLVGRMAAAGSPLSAGGSSARGRSNSAGGLAGQGARVQQQWGYSPPTEGGAAAQPASGDAAALEVVTASPQVRALRRQEGPGGEQAAMDPCVLKSPRRGLPQPRSHAARQG